MKTNTTIFVALLMASILLFTPVISAQAQFVIPSYVQIESMSALQSTSNILFLGYKEPEQFLLLGMG